MAIIAPAMMMARGTANFWTVSMMNNLGFLGKYGADYITRFSSKTEGFRQSIRRARSQPFRGVQFHLFFDTEFLEFQQIVLEGIIEDLFRYFNVLEAVFAQLLHVALLPPLDGLQSRAALFRTKRAFCNGIETHATAEDFGNL